MLVIVYFDIFLEKVCKSFLVGTTLHVVSTYVKLCFVGGGGSQNFGFDNQKNLSEEDEAHKVHFKTVYFQNSC